MHLIPTDQAFAFAVALCVIGITAAVFGLATIIDTERGRASAGDACMAFGLVCCIAAAKLVNWDDMAIPALGAVALVRMVLAIVAAARRRREPRDEGRDRISRWTAGRDARPEAPAAEPADEITVRFETPIDEDDLFRRPDRPRAAMDAVVRQLGKGASIVAIRARRGEAPEGAEKE